MGNGKSFGKQKFREEVRGQVQDRNTTIASTRLPSLPANFPDPSLFYERDFRESQIATTTVLNFLL